MHSIDVFALGLFVGAVVVVGALTIWMIRVYLDRRN